MSHAERPSSTSSSSIASCPIDSVPAKPACSPLEPYGDGRRDQHVGTRGGQTRSQSATAMSVSVDSGRCGPCCSVEPIGTARTAPRRDAVATSGQVRSAS